LSRIMDGVRSCRLESAVRLMLFRIILYSVNLHIAKVKTFWRFGTVIIPWNNCRPDADQHDSMGQPRDA
jgi:hypothetical protein